jgi:hypothetical protein
MAQLLLLSLDNTLAIGTKKVRLFVFAAMFSYERNVTAGTNFFSVPATTEFFAFKIITNQELLMDSTCFEGKT